MIEIKANSVAYFIKNGYLGIDLTFDEIAEYSSFLNAGYAAFNIKTKESEKDNTYWSYVLYSSDNEKFSPSSADGMVYLIEKENKKYGVIELPIESFLNNTCKVTNLFLKKKYTDQLKIIELAKKYYKEKLSSIEINIEFHCVTDHDMLVHAEAFNLTTTAFIMKSKNQKVHIEKQLREDLKKYDFEDFSLDCPKSITLINMIAE